MSKQIPLSQIVPAGTVIYVARSTAPIGYVKANGATLSRTTYADLFSAIGTTFGIGDGSTTFQLPDMRGEFPRGWDDGRGVDSGRALGSAQADELKSHGHGIATGYAETGSVYRVGANPRTNYVQDATTLNAGGTETRPRNIALLACIKI